MREPRSLTARLRSPRTSPLKKKLAKKPAGDHLPRRLSPSSVAFTFNLQSGKPDRHVYALTEQGRKELHRWLAEGIVPKIERNEFLLKLFFGEEVAAATNIKHVEKYRELQLHLLEKYEAVEQEIKAKYADDSNLPYWLMTLGYGQHVSQALLRWCDETLSTLNKIKKVSKKHGVQSKRLDEDYR